MSNTVQTLSAAIRKSFAPLQAETFINGIVPFAADETVKPSAIKMNKGTAGAAMGAKATPQAFITGLTFFVTAFAWGQGKLETLQAGLPSHAQFALVAACSHVKFGAGISAGTLRRAVMHGLERMLALPAPEKKAPAKVTAPETAPETATETAPEADQGDKAPALSGLLEVARMESEHAREWGAYGDALAQAFKAARTMQAAQADLVAQFNSFADSDADKALSMLQSMAAHLGLVVRKAPAKRTGTNG